MKHFICLIISLITFLSSYSQIFKKQAPKIPTHLDSIKVYEHLSGVNLDTVYNILSEKYGVKIIYDTAVCNEIIYSYWYGGESILFAVQISARLEEFNCTVDSDLTIHVVPKHPHALKHPSKQFQFQQKKFEGNPENRNFTLSGNIIDDSTNIVLEGAYINVKGTSVSTVSDKNGHYTLNNVPSDTVTVTINHIGYLPLDVFITPQINKADFVISIHHAEHVLDEAIVTANRIDLMKMSGPTISTIKLSPEKLSEIPNVGEKDIMRTFQLMPGISAANESSSGLYVRGGTPDQNLVLYDGFTVYQVDHLYGFFSAFNANAIKEVELYKGGFDAKYGGRLSSVTDIQGKEGSKTQFNLGGDISLLSGNIFTEIPITEDLSLVAAARRSWRGPIYNWIFNSFNKSTSSSTSSGKGPGGADNVTKAKSYFYDINTKLTFKPTKKDIVSYSFFNGSDDLNNSFSVNTPAFLEQLGINFNFGTTDVTNYSNTGMSLSWLRNWNSKFHSNTVVSYSNYESSRDRVTTGNVFMGGDTTTTKTGIFEKNNLKDLSFRSDYEWSFAKWNSIGFGVSATQFDISYRYSQNDTSWLINKRTTGLLTGGYLQDKFILFNGKLTLTGGMRLSYFDVTSRLYKEPRLAITYQATEKISFKAAYGQYYQFANRITREDISAGSSEFWVLSDGKTVPVSSATHYIAGLNYESGKYLFGIEGYYKNLNNITQYTERLSANTAGINYDENFLIGSGYSQGVEFMMQKKIGKLTGWVSYTLGKTMDLFQAYSSSYFPADQDVRHEFKIVTMYKKDRWDFAATWVYASGRPYTAPGGSYSVTLLDGTTQNYFTVTSKNTLRLPDYHRMDIAVNYHIHNEAKKDIGYIGLSLFNVYARKNIWYKEFTVVSNHIVETNVDYLSFTPNLTLSLKMH